MPNLNGHDAFNAMRRCNPRVKCIFVSGFGFDPQGPHQLGSGTPELVQKPFHINDLFRKVADALRG
jgi:FixJ family two-component response regulator